MKERRVLPSRVRNHEVVRSSRRRPALRPIAPVVRGVCPFSNGRRHEAVIRKGQSKSEWSGSDDPAVQPIGIPGALHT